MTLITQAQTTHRIANYQAQMLRIANEEPTIDFIPVVKLFTPDAQCTWLLTELGPDDIAYGLSDLNMGCPEVGLISMRALREYRGPLGLPLECDQHFRANRSLYTYVAEARATGRLVL